MRLNYTQIIMARIYKRLTLPSDDEDVDQLIYSCTCGKKVKW